MAPRAPWTAPPRLLPVALGVLLLGTARKWWAWCKSKSPPACDPPGQTGSPGATGEAQGARLPQAAMPQSRRRPPPPGAGGAALACDPQAHSREWGPATPTGAAASSPDLPCALRGVRRPITSCRWGTFPDPPRHGQPSAPAAWNPGVGPRAHAGPCPPSAPAGLGGLLSLHVLPAHEAAEDSPGPECHRQERSLCFLTPHLRLQVECGEGRGLGRPFLQVRLTTRPPQAGAGGSCCSSCCW